MRTVTESLPDFRNRHLFESRLYAQGKSDQHVLEAVIDLDHNSRQLPILVEDGRSEQFRNHQPTCKPAIKKKPRAKRAGYSLSHAVNEFLRFATQEPASFGIVQFALKFDKTWVGAQTIEFRVNFQKDEPVGAVVVGFPQPVHGQLCPA